MPTLAEGEAGWPVLAWVRVDRGRPPGLCFLCWAWAEAGLVVSAAGLGRPGAAMRPGHGFIAEAGRQRLLLLLLLPLPVALEAGQASILLRQIYREAAATGRVRGVGDMWRQLWQRGAAGGGN